MSAATQPASIEGIEFDALVSLSESYEADVPEYPTEKGYSVSDSIITHPRTLDVMAYITDTPVTWKQRFGGRRNARAVVDELKRLFWAKQLVTFRTAEDTYENMGITSLTVPKDADSGNAYEIALTLKEVTTTEAKMVAVTASYPRGGATGTNAGTANTSATVAGKGGGSTTAQSKEEGQASASILYGMANSIGLFK